MPLPPFLQNFGRLLIHNDTKGDLPIARLDTTGGYGDSTPAASEASVVLVDPASGTTYPVWRRVADLFVASNATGGASTAPGGSATFSGTVSRAIAADEVMAWEAVPSNTLTLAGGQGYVNVSGNFRCSVNGTSGISRGIGIRMVVDGLVLGEQTVTPGSDSTGGTTVTTSFGPYLIALPAGLRTHSLRFEWKHAGATARTIYANGSSITVTAATDIRTHAIIGSEHPDTAAATPHPGFVLGYDHGTERWTPTQVNPMTARGDLVIGAAAVGLTAGANAALVSRGASATSSGNYLTSLPSAAIDGSDATSWEANGTASGQWLRVDLGVARSVYGIRLVQVTGRNATGYRVQSSPDDTTWTDRLTVTGNSSLDQSHALTAPVSARYFRVITDAATAGRWRVATFEVRLTGGSPAGVATARLAVGTTGQFLRSDGTDPVWQTVTAGDIGAAATGHTHTYQAPLTKLAGQSLSTAEATIAHGLSGTPSVVLITALGDGYAWVSTASDATNVYVTASAAITADIYVAL